MLLQYCRAVDFFFFSARWAGLGKLTLSAALDASSGLFRLCRGVPKSRKRAYFRKARLKFVFQNATILGFRATFCEFANFGATTVLDKFCQLDKKINCTVLYIFFICQLAIISQNMTYNSRNFFSC